MMVIERAVMAAVLLNLTPSSSKKALLELITVVTVTPPLPLPVAVTVRATVVVWVRAPLVPVTVTFVVPVVAVLEAVKVRVLVVVVEAGLKLAVTPVGRPLAESVTVPVNPFTGVIVIVLLPVAPCATLTALPDSEKSGVFLTTVTEMVVVCVSEPLVPVMVTVDVPATAVLEALNVTVFPLSEAVTPEGVAPTLKVTLPVKPLKGVTVIVLLAAAPPWVTETLTGFADSEKSGWPVTVRTSVVV